MSSGTTLAASSASALIARLHDPDAYPHEVARIECVQTHISWVLLTGSYAYKIKKPVDMGFLDFSTLRLRHEACLAELRLNSRLAAQLYIDIVPIVGPVESAKVGGSGEPVEYAVRMHQFEQADQLDRLLEAGKISTADITRVAQRIARSHDEATSAGIESDYGAPGAIRQPMEATLRTLDALLTDAEQRQALERLSDWSRDCFRRLEATFARRRQEGFVRECHGDLHMGNLVRHGDDIVPFDCIEFSAELRWIDVVSDMGFLMMDLLYRARPEFAFQLINSYLELRGDYAGVAVLRYYLVYRALVRTMVALLRRQQFERQGLPALAIREDADSHLRLAFQLTDPPSPLLFLMHGFSGSGKTFVSSKLLQHWPAIRVRSDVERKRLLGVGASQTTRSGLGADAYSQDVSEATYQRLLDAAASALQEGFSAIVDATSLLRSQRQRFRDLAAIHGVRFVIIDCVAPVPELRRRLRERFARGSDASEADEAVLEEQLKHAEPLNSAEQTSVVTVPPGLAGDTEALVDACHGCLARCPSSTPPRDALPQDDLRDPL